MSIRPVTGRPLIYLMLHEPVPSGLAIGRIGADTIYEFVTDGFGKCYRYVGLAPRRWSGEIDGDALRAGEFILPPNLVYQLEHKRVPRTPGDFGALWAGLVSVFSRSTGTPGR
jgi:hypothetical protein